MKNNVYLIIPPIKYGVAARLRHSGGHTFGRTALIVAITACFQFTTVSYARNTNNSSSGKITPKPPSVLAVCGNPVAQIDLDINNVRCRLFTAGDMWWNNLPLNAGAPQYEIPKGSGIHSSFAGALWIGGYDQGGQLRVAGQTYGHSTGNNDFWPGPLDTNAEVNDDVCNQYDKHFSITRQEVEDFVNGIAPATQAINDWPGNGNTALGQAQYLAPYVDKNSDGKYNPSDGDYPGFDLTGVGCVETNCIPNDQLYGDQSIWWVFNDKGDIHAETGGAPIGLEIRAQAFGFSTDDEINNMTFYNYRIYNRSTFQLDTCYFGVWADLDLGNYQDDYVGCDVSRGLGYTYNSDDDDEVSAKGYGLNPPAIGIDFFRGPITNPAGVAGDGIDNDRDCKIDEACEQAIMSKFVYYTNGGGFPMQDPANAVEYYNYLSGRWQNGAPWTYGGTGIGGTTVADFCYPGSSDHQYEWGTGGNCTSPAPSQPDWNETVICTNNCDRRMMQSAGPFTLLPGAVNVITTGAVWARASSGGASASVSLLKLADDKAQALFNNCFKVLNGPDAPDLTIQELNKSLILYLSNRPSSNNYLENYSEFDPFISLVDSLGKPLKCVDTTYNFEGYKIFQLKDASSTELDNTDQARLLIQCDLKNGVSRIINYEFDPALGATVPKEKVIGSDKGIFHSLVVTKDLFATGDNTLINHKTYYYAATAYGYNNFKPYKQDVVPNKADNKCPLPSSPTPATDGQKNPYKQGRKNIHSYSAIPHIPSGESGGTEMHASYGSGPMITRIEGNGNGGMTLDFTAATISAILSSGVYSASAPSNALYKTPAYEYGAGPINVRVVDPLNVPEDHNFTLKFDSANIANSTWTLTNNTTGEIINSDKTIKYVDEKLLLQWGLSVSIVQISEPGSASSEKNGFLSATMTFSDATKAWLTALADKDGSNSYSNWIRSGKAPAGDPFQEDYTLDNGQVYEGVLEGTWAPYRLTASTKEPITAFDPAKYYTGPGFRNTYMTGQVSPQMNELASVNVVLTADQSLWTRCVVLEMCEDTLYTESYPGLPRARKLDFRRAPSVDKNGSTNTGPDNSDFATGMGWFPGYAINLETGERLNMAFGENSALAKRPGSGAINYNLRGTIGYGTLKGTFLAGEKITDSVSVATAIIVTDNGTNSMKVQSITGTFGSDTIYGKTSGAKAFITSLAGMGATFQRGETVTGGTSGATGVIDADMSSTSMMVLKPVTGTFAAAEEITGSISTAFAGVTTSYSPYDFNQNGADMKWNPTTKSTGKVPWSAVTTSPVFGGQHYIYVFGHNKTEDTTGSPGPNEFGHIPRYDKGKRMREILDVKGGLNPDDNVDRKLVFRDAMWVNIPLLASGHDYLETDVTIRLRVGKSYKKGYSPAFLKDGLATIYTDTASVAFGQNKNLPMYTFSTEGIATHTGETEIAIEALDLIKVVPNPYYAFSAYETSQLDNRVKITNLPEVCTVSIYNLSGTLIRKYKKAEPLTMHTPKTATDPDTWHDGSLDWDLKNTVGIPISSGVYIIHVEVPGVGEKVVKWFGIMRPIDLDSF